MKLHIRALLDHRLSRPFVAGYHLLHRIRKVPPGSFRILMFHDVGPAQTGQFERLIRHLAETGRVLEPRDVEARVCGNHRPGTDGHPGYLVTFDDGFKSQFDVAGQILRTYGVKAVFFVCPDLIDRQASSRPADGSTPIHLPAFAQSTLMSWREIKTLVEMGHTVGSHGGWHQRFSALSGDDLRREVVQSGDRLEEQIGATVTWIAFPYGTTASINSRAFQVVSSRYRLCCSGVRGINSVNSNPLELLRENIDLRHPFEYQRLVAEGGLDFGHAAARHRLRTTLRKATAARAEPSKPAKIVFAMTGAYGDCGGVANVNRNVLSALTEIAERTGAGLRILSLAEKPNDRPDSLPPSAEFVACQGNRAKFTVALFATIRDRPLFCFDHVSLAIPLLPFAATGAIRTVIFAHASESWKRLRTVSRWCYSSATLCLTNSEFTLRKMRERISHFNGVACPLGLSPVFPLNADIPDPREGHIELEAVDERVRALGKRVLLLVARIDAGEGLKGHQQMIAILPELVSEFPDVQLVMPGPGENREAWKTLARQYGVQASVFLPGFVTTEMLRRLYAHCYAFVMPSRQEGFGLVYLEAMNFAKPCVGCFDQGTEDVIVHGETGFLLHDPDCARELLEPLQRLLSDPELAQTLGRRGFERLHTSFTARHYRERVTQNIAAVMTEA